MVEETLLDLLMLRDRLYFREHPDCCQYIRDYVPGEFYPLAQESEIKYVLVTKIDEHSRLRQPLSTRRGMV